MESSDFFKNFRNQIRSSKRVESNNVHEEMDDDYDHQRQDILSTIDNAVENKDGFDGAYVDDFDVNEEMKNIEELSKYDTTTKISKPQTQPGGKSKKVPVLDYIFTPKNDITVYELARLLSYIQMSIDQNVFENMPIELKKHFTKCID